MKFRKKPIVIDAIQFTGNNHGELGAFDWRLQSSRSDGVVIRTLEGEMRAEPGDWIIRGIKGELYPCRDDIFLATYEPVGD